MRGACLGSCARSNQTLVSIKMQNTVVAGEEITARAPQRCNARVVCLCRFSTRETYSDRSCPTKSIRTRSLRPTLRFRRARHATQSRLNIFPIPHRHCRRFPSPRLHHGRQVNVERQHILRRPDPDRMTADVFCFFRCHAHKLGNPFEGLSNGVHLCEFPLKVSPFSLKMSSCKSGLAALWWLVFQRRKSDNSIVPTARLATSHSNAGVTICFQRVLNVPTQPRYRELFRHAADQVVAGKYRY
jgi:hypothetical protein